MRSSIPGRIAKALVLGVAALAVAGHFLLWHDDFLLSGNSGVAVVVRASQTSLYFGGTLSLLLLAWATFATRRPGAYVALTAIALTLYLSATTVVVTLLFRIISESRGATVPPNRGAARMGRPARRRRNPRARGADLARSTGLRAFRGIYGRPSST